VDTITLGFLPRRRADIMFPNPLFNPTLSTWKSNKERDEHVNRVVVEAKADDGAGDSSTGREAVRSSNDDNNVDL
jgi:hypothetical protein